MERAAAQREGHAAALAGLAIANIGLGADPADSEPVVARAVALERTDPVVHLATMRLLAASGERAEAARELGASLAHLDTRGWLGWKHLQRR